MHEEPLERPETRQETPSVEGQKSWEADTLWNASRDPLQTFSLPTKFVNDSAAVRHNQDAANALGRSSEDCSR